MTLAKVMLKNTAGIDQFTSEMMKVDIETTTWLRNYTKKKSGKRKTTYMDTLINKEDGTSKTAEGHSNI